MALLKAQTRYALKTRTWKTALDLFGSTKLSTWLSKLTARHVSAPAICQLVRISATFMIDCGKFFREFSRRPANGGGARGVRFSQWGWQRRNGLLRHGTFPPLCRGTKWGWCSSCHACRKFGACFSDGDVGLVETVFSRFIRQIPILYDLSVGAEGEVWWWVTVVRKTTTGYGSKNFDVVRCWKILKPKLGTGMREEGGWCLISPIL